MSADEWSNVEVEGNPTLELTPQTAYALTTICNAAMTDGGEPMIAFAAQHVANELREAIENFAVAASPEKTLEMLDEAEADLDDDAPLAVRDGIRDLRAKAKAAQAKPITEAEVEATDVDDAIAKILADPNIGEAG